VLGIDIDCCWVRDHFIVRERSVENESLLVLSDLQLGAKIKSCSWVRRKVGDREKKREDLLTKSVDQNYNLYLNISEAQLCGRIPRERVNHVYFVWYV
jgi:hypothetical protein